MAASGLSSFLAVAGRRRSSLAVATSAQTLRRAMPVTANQCRKNARRHEDPRERERPQRRKGEFAARGRLFARRVHRESALSSCICINIWRVPNARKGKSKNLLIPIGSVGRRLQKKSKTKNNRNRKCTWFHFRTSAAAALFYFCFPSESKLIIIIFFAAARHVVRKRCERLRALAALVGQVGVWAACENR